MNWFPILADVIAWPFYLIGGLGVVLVIALVAVVVAVTVAIIKRRNKK